MTKIKIASNNGNLPASEPKIKGEKTKSKSRLTYSLLIGLLSLLVVSPAFANHAYSGYKWNYDDPAYHIDSSLYNLNMYDGSNEATVVNTGVAKWNGFSDFYLHVQSGSWGWFGAADLDPGIMGLTSIYVYPFTNIIYSSETRFNTDYRWANYDGYWLNPPAYNLCWVATHEAGHWVALNDLADSSSVMYYAYSSAAYAPDGHSIETVKSLYGG